jgi:drug/metabolite transporter (DMT)-like permease
LILDEISLPVKKFPEIGRLIIYYNQWTFFQVSRHLKISGHKPSIPPLAVLPFGILAASTAAIFIRFAQQEAPSLAVAASRLSIATLILSPYVLFRYRKELSTIKANQIGLLVLSGIFLALHFWSWMSSLEFTTVASSVVLVTTSPLWVVLLSPLVLHEKLGRNVIIGLVVALVGGMIIGMSETCHWQGGLVCGSLGDFIQGKAFIGNLLALAGAWFAAGYMLIGRKVRSGISNTAYIFVVYGTSAVVLLFGVALLGYKLTGYPPVTYAWFIALAVIPQLIGHSTFNWVLKYISAAVVSITLLGEPIGSTILAFFILKETPTLTEGVGAVFILVGIYLASRQDRLKPINENQRE